MKKLIMVIPTPVSKSNFTTLTSGNKMMALDYRNYAKQYKANG